MTSSGEMRNRIDSVLTKLAGSRERFIRGGAESCGGYRSNGLQDPKEWRDPEFVERFLHNFENRTIPSQRLVSGGSSASRIESILSKLANGNLRYVRGGAKGKPASGSKTKSRVDTKPKTKPKKEKPKKEEPKKSTKDPNYGKKGRLMSEEDIGKLMEETEKEKIERSEKMRELANDPIKYLNFISKKPNNPRLIPRPTIDSETGRLSLKVDLDTEYNRLINLIRLNEYLIQRGSIDKIVYNKDQVAKELMKVVGLVVKKMNDASDKTYDFTRGKSNRKDSIKEYGRMAKTFEDLMKNFNDKDPTKLTISNFKRQNVDIPRMQKIRLDSSNVTPIVFGKDWDSVFTDLKVLKKLNLADDQGDEETQEAKAAVVQVAEQSIETVKNQTEEVKKKMGFVLSQLLSRSIEADNVDEINDALDNFEESLFEPSDSSRSVIEPEVLEVVSELTDIHQIIYENAVEKAVEAAEQARSEGLPEEEVQAEALEAAEEEASTTYNEDIPEDQKENINVEDLVEIARIAAEDALQVKQDNAMERVKEIRKNEIMKAIKAIAGEVARESIQDGSNLEVATEKAKEAATEALTYGDRMVYVDFPEMMSAVNDAIREIRDETQPSTSTQSSTQQEPMRPEMLGYLNDLDDNFLGDLYGDSEDEMQDGIASDGEQDDFVPADEAVKIEDNLQQKILNERNPARKVELELEGDDMSESDRDESGYETPDEDGPDDDEPGKDIGVNLKKKGMAKLLSAILGEDFDDEGSVGYLPQQRGSKSTVGYAPKPKVTGQKSKVDRALDKYLREGKEPRDNYSRLAANLDNELRVKSGLKPKKDEDRPTHNVRKSNKKKKPVEVEEEEEEKPKQVKKKTTSGSKTAAKKKSTKKEPVKKTTKRKPKTNPVDIEAERDKLEAKLYEEEAVKEQKVQKSRRGPLKGKPLPTAKGGKMIIEETVRSTPMMSKIEVVAKTRPMTAWNAHVAATSRKHKGKPFPEIIKIAKKTYKK